MARDDREVLALRRLRNLRLLGTPLERAEDVVRWLGAVQSQEYAVAKWSIGQRTGGVGEDELDRALADGTILRTHVLRPTWHFVPAADIRWMIELTGPRVQAGNAYWNRRFGLDEALLARSSALMARELAGGRHLTRKELAAVLHREGIAAEGLRLGYILMRGELDLLLCSGVAKGKQQTYALLDERAPQAAPLTRDEALAELTRRYFTSHGPATLADYTWWSTLTATDARAGIEMVGSQLERMVAADRTYWFAPSPAGAEEAAPRAHLLQGYDEYIVGYSESRDVLDVGGVARQVPEGEAMFTHAVALDGQVLGHWRRLVKAAAKAVTIEVQLATALDRAQREALDAEVDRYGTFVGLPATWR
jgi:hypothetical protein